MPSIFNYSDYRSFLKDHYRERKKAGRRFTYRAFCSAAGIKSPGHLMLILAGKADISLDLARRLCAAIEFNKRESEYFIDLVRFNQADSHEAKRSAFEKMLSFRESSVRQVGADQYEYYRAWYHSVIRALVEFVPVRDEYGMLADLVDPSITEAQARRSVELLLKLGMLCRDGQGRLRPAEASLDTGVQGGSTAIINYGLSTLDLAMRKIAELPPEERKFSWVTVGVSEKGYGEILDLMRKFRANAAAIAARDKAERVYQINMQAFPLSKTHTPANKGRV